MTYVITHTKQPNYKHDTMPNNNFVISNTISLWALSAVQMKHSY